jgi:plastocyanin
MKGLSMWSIVEPASGLTNKVTVPADGIISVAKPQGVEVSAYINDVSAPLHHLHVKAGDVVNFEFVNHSVHAHEVCLDYGGVKSTIAIPPCEPTASTASTTEGTIMTHMVTPAGGDVNYFAHPGMGMGYGGGGGLVGGSAGAAGLGGLVGAALGSGGGLFGGGFGGGRRGFDGSDNVVTPTELQSALNGQTANQNTNTILQMLGGIAASIPENEGKVQLAIANSQNALAAAASAAQVMNVQLDSMSNLATANGFANMNQQVRNSHDDLSSSLCQLSAQGAAQTYALNSAIRDDGDKTRALIIAQNDATLNRIITNQANEIIELKGDKNFANTGLNINQTVTQVQAQQQQQQQQQQILFTLGQIVPLLGNLQNAVATNSNLIVGNTGAVATGPQTANPVNVKG